MLAAGIDLIAVSVGVLADADYRDRVLTTAKGSGASLEIPAGAIGGIDAIAAARHAGLTRVTYITGVVYMDGDASGVDARLEHSQRAGNVL